MATYELPNKDMLNSTTYLDGANIGSVRITSLTDGESGLELSVGDKVTVMWFDIRLDKAGPPFEAEYIGTMRVGSQEFIVSARVKTT